METTSAKKRSDNRLAGGVMTSTGTQDVYIINIYEPGDGDGAEIYAAGATRTEALQNALRGRPVGTLAELVERLDMRRMLNTGPRLEPNDRHLNRCRASVTPDGIKFKR